MNYTICILLFYLKDNTINQLLVNRIIEQSYLNPYNNNILSTDAYNKKYFIAYTILGMIGKYYIEGKGIVPRWTKMHRLIKQAYKDLN